MVIFISIIIEFYNNDFANLVGKTKNNRYILKDLYALDFEDPTYDTNISVWIDEAQLTFGYKTVGSGTYQHYLIFKSDGHIYYDGDKLI